jgi:very-short-patch-repair endonuclease
VRNKLKSYTGIIMKLRYRVKRLQRLIKPSPAEKAFLETMGWWWRIRYRTRREYPVAGYLIDVAIPSKRVGFEIDGAAYHSDVIGKWEKDQQRDRHIYRKGWLVCHISAKDALYNKEKTKYIVRYFLIHGKYPDKFPKRLLVS